MMDTPPDTLEDDDVITGELVEPEPDPFAGIAALGGMFGLDVGPMLDALKPDPNAVTLDDVKEALDQMRAGLLSLAQALEPVVQVSEALIRNAPKLRKYGITL